jgi:hypothetical protein
VFPVRYDQNSYILFRINSVFKVLKYAFGDSEVAGTSSSDKLFMVDVLSIRFRRLGFKPIRASSRKYFRLSVIFIGWPRTQSCFS